MKTSKLHKNVELVLVCFGAIQSIYLALFSFFERKRNVKNHLLGLFFFSITIRIIKSILWVYLSETPDWFINFGFAAHLAFGPLLHLYTYYFIRSKKWSHFNLLHFIPVFLVVANSFSISTTSFWNIGGYSVLLYHQIIYTGITIYLFIMGVFKRRELNFKSTEWLWLSLLVIGTTFLQLSYFSNYILGIVPYLMGPMVYGVYIFFLSFFLIRNQQILNTFNKKKKYENINFSEEILESRANDLNLLMTEEKPFLDSNFSLKDLSQTLGLPVYLTSHLINKYLGKNFSEYINEYRVKEAIKLFEKREYEQIKISHVAFECGFNSLSSFNKAFKKCAGKTPSTYRKKLTNL